MRFAGNTSKSLHQSFQNMTSRRNEGPSSKYWCFTINHPNETDFEQLSFENWRCVQEAVYNLEVGESGTPHLQGYIALTRHKTLSWMKRRLTRAHLEKRKGSREQAIVYCLKDCVSAENDSSLDFATADDNSLSNTLTLPNPYPVLYGFPCGWEELNSSCSASIQMKMPRSKALISMKKMIEDGANDEELASFHFPTFISSYRGLTLYRSLCVKARDFKSTVYVCQGPTGTGKSKWALETFPNAYWKQRSNWWDGYCGQETVIIDEFYGWLPFDLCLRLCDRYPLLVETKGGNVQFVAKRIIFTSNALPSSWWKNCYFPSFARRVDEWHIFPVWGMHVFYSTYEEAVAHFFTNL